MTAEIWYPFTASPLYLVAVLLVALVLFDLFLIRVFTLDSVAWKRVDYVWLTAAAVGLVGSATEVRRTVAAVALEATTVLEGETYSSIQDHVQFMMGPAVCITFQRSPLSPSNIQQVQDEHDAACRFAKQVMVALPKVSSAFDPEVVRFKRPQMTAPVLVSIFGALDRAVGEHLRWAQQRVKMTHDAGRSSGEVAFAASAPFILALALALRIVKVTGEIRIERRGD